EGGQGLRLLDYGTGSGCLAIYLATQFPAAEVHAVDLSPAALARARQNAARHGVESRLLFHEGDGMQGVPGGLDFDAVVSNPPYIPTSELGGLQPEVRDHDPRLALDGGADGLTFYRRLASEVPPVLRDGGRLLVELGDDQAPGVRSLLESQNWVVAAVHDDYSARARVLVAGRDGAAQISDLTQHG
ncbi:MAG TPA: hypothetical protein DCM86_08035, partial [Verrucomicrobiales bacterium]|nr:hypothetical protein [Verrucomicrobiales bacterium]